MIGRVTAGLIQPKVVVPDSTFARWITLGKKTMLSLNSFQRYWWSKNPATWLNERQNWPHQTKKVASDAFFVNYLYEKNLMMKKDRLILSRDIDDPRMLQYDWLSAFQVITEEADFSQTFGFSRIIKNTIMHHFSKRQPSRLNFWQNKKNPILEEFFGFFPEMRVFLKNSTPSVSDMQNFRKILRAVFEKNW